MLQFTVFMPLLLFATSTLSKGHSKASNTQELCVTAPPSANASPRHMHVEHQPSF